MINWPLTIEVPPLKARPGDIKELLFHQIATCCERDNLDLKGVAPDFLEALANYPWPGNIREFFNAIDVAVGNARYEPTLYVKHLPVNIRVQLTQYAGGAGLPEAPAGQAPNPTENDLTAGVPPSNAKIHPVSPQPFKSYRDDSSHLKPAEPSGPGPDPAAVAALPPAILAKLEQALISLDPKLIRDAIAEVKAHDAALSQAMSELAVDYQAHRLLRLVRRIPSPESPED